MAQNAHIFLETERVFAAPGERVFRAWTEPEKLKRWWYAGNGWRTSIAEVDLRVGGSYCFGMKSVNGDENIARGIYQEVIIPEKLVFSWCWDHMPKEETVVTLSFVALAENSTRLVLKHDKFSSEDMCLRHQKGWNLCMTELSTNLFTRS